MRKYTVIWDMRQGKRQQFTADDHEWAKTGSVVALVKDGEQIALVSQFQQVIWEEIEE